MKANELMIGDWVSYCGFYNKVIYIGQKVSMYNGKGTEFTTDPEHIRPIPLTEEILVKNGWRKESITIDGDYANWLGEIPICQEEDEFNYERIELTYVHQLQHLLRLVGVQKEIEL